MTQKLIKLSIVVLSAACLIISCGLFWNLGVYADENNTSIRVVLGGDFWSLLYWVMIFFNFIILVLSVINLYGKK